MMLWLDGLQQNEYSGRKILSTWVLECRGGIHTIARSISPLMTFWQSSKMMLWKSCSWNLNPIWISKLHLQNVAKPSGARKISRTLFASSVVICSRSTVNGLLIISSTNEGRCSAARTISWIASSRCTPSVMSFLISSEYIFVFWWSHASNAASCASMNVFSVA